MSKKLWNVADEVGDTDEDLYDKCMSLDNNLNSLENKVESVLFVFEQLVEFIDNFKDNHRHHWKAFHQV